MSGDTEYNMDAFSTPAEHAFDHEVEVSAEAGPSSMGDAVAAVSIEEAFDVENTIQRIISGGYKTVSDWVHSEVDFQDPRTHR